MDSTLVTVFTSSMRPFCQEDQGTNSVFSSLYLFLIDWFYFKYLFSHLQDDERVRRHPLEAEEDRAAQTRAFQGVAELAASYRWRRHGSEVFFSMLM